MLEERGMATRLEDAHSPVKAIHAVKRRLRVAAAAAVNRDYNAADLPGLAFSSEASTQTGNDNEPGTSYTSVSKTFKLLHKHSFAQLLRHHAQHLIDLFA